MRKYHDSLFKYHYGMSSEEQLDFCLKRLPSKARASLSDTFDARWLSYQIDHLTRFIAAGRGYPSPMESLYGESILLPKIKQSYDFVGKTIEFPVPVSYRTVKI